AGGDATDHLAVAAQLVVDPGVPVGEEHGALHARLGEVAHLAHRHQPGAEVDHAADLEADVVAQLDAGGEHLDQLVVGEELGEAALDEGGALLDVVDGDGHGAGSGPRGWIRTTDTRFYRPLP